jgi:hypothetical protein
VLVGDAGLARHRLRGAAGLGAARARVRERVELPWHIADDVASVSAVFVRPFWIGDGARSACSRFLQTRLWTWRPATRS